MSGGRLYPGTLRSLTGRYRIRIVTFLYGGISGSEISLQLVNQIFSSHVLQIPNYAIRIR